MVEKLRVLETELEALAVNTHLIVGELYREIEDAAKDGTLEGNTKLRRLLSQAERESAKAHVYDEIASKIGQILKPEPEPEQGDGSTLHLDNLRCTIEIIEETIAKAEDETAERTRMLEERAERYREQLRKHTGCDCYSLRITCQGHGTATVVGDDGGDKDEFRVVMLENEPGQNPPDEEE